MVTHKHLIPYPKKTHLGVLTNTHEKKNPNTNYLHSVTVRMRPMLPGYLGQKLLSIFTKALTTLWMEFQASK